MSRHWPSGLLFSFTDKHAGAHVGLTSPALEILLAVAVAALLAVILAAWRRLAGPGVRKAAFRVLALCALQATVLSLIFVLVNRSAEFYASWSDLVGADSGGGRLALAVRTGAASRPDSVTRLSRIAVHVPGTAAAGGRLDSIRIHGALSGLTVPGRLYLPAAYRLASPGQRFPVIMVLSNAEASESSAWGARRLAAAAAEQIAERRMPPTIIIDLPAWLGRSDRACLNVPGGTQAQTFFAQDVPRILETRYLAAAGPARWAVAGDSSGGYCALSLVLGDSAAFGVAVAPHAEYAQLPGTGETGGSELIRTQDSLAWQLRNGPPQPVSVLFAGPGASPGLGPAGPLAALARWPMRVASAGLPGGRQPLAPVLDWIAGAMARRAGQRAGQRASRGWGSRGWD
jgi:enterochelin esterase-like enzyme